MTETKKPRSTKAVNDLEATYVRSILSYDPETGDLRWRVRRGGRGFAGALAGKFSKYLMIGIDGKSYYGHRLAHVIMTGSWPDANIDHHNGNPHDNRWVNLRQATQEKNCRNQAKKSTNKTGYKGVDYVPKHRKFRGTITVRYKTIFLGYFDTAQEAHAAYRRAAIERHGEFARFE